MLGRTYKFLTVVFVLCLGFGISSAQSVDNLRKEKDVLLREIEQSKELLKRKRSSRESTLQQLQLVERELTIKEDIVRAFQNQIKDLDRTIDHNQSAINDLEGEIDVLKAEYAKLLQDTYLRSSSLNELAFFLGSVDFSEAYRRYRVLKEYADYRRRQVLLLKERQNQMIALHNDIKFQKESKESALKAIENELRSLEATKKEKAKLVNYLKSEESWLLKQINEKEAQAKNLEQKILDFIKVSSVSTQGTDFSTFQGKLIWPVRKGTIINRFGEHEHPVLKNVTIKNNGIDIQSAEDDGVFCVHNGEVSRVVAIPGFNTTVLIRHGKYLTVYANLIEVEVKQGQKIDAGAKIGRIFRDDISKSMVLHFEIWNENQKVDPAIWLQK